METPTQHVPEKKQEKSTHRCLSCGTSENMARRRYCAVACRQFLRRKLDQRTGLLRALNIRYATFYFTDAVIVLDLMPYSERRIFSFLYPRNENRVPGDDVSDLGDILGKTWWAEHGRTRKNYLAARHVLSQSSRKPLSPGRISPVELHIPALRGSALVHLNLDEAALVRPECMEIIKRAYRKQALRHHPDHGGDSRSFIRIHRAYEELLTWAKSPSFIRRRGFFDKWFFDGDRNVWVQPIPVSRQA
ncbi:DnaJ domain-containing protein [Desulfococcus sp.]|uniref:DnaJ domain-containing protein n=1 Tax=Desulfococcus sp. TaxID=2025834 RepID=UPI003593CE2B